MTTLYCFPVSFSETSYFTFSLFDVSKLSYSSFALQFLSSCVFLNSAVAHLCSPLKICPFLPVSLLNINITVFCYTRRKYAFFDTRTFSGCLFRTFGSSLDILFRYFFTLVSGHTKIFNDSQFIRYLRKNYENDE